MNLLRSKEGTILQSNDEIKQRWTQYCFDLYKDHGGGDEVVEELEEITPFIDEDPQDILYAEVQAAIGMLKKNKSPGSDGITAEMLQAGGNSQYAKCTSSATERGTKALFRTSGVDPSWYRYQRKEILAIVGITGRFLL